MTHTVNIASRLRNLVLPARPDPARSRRIAEVRLVISAVAVHQHLTQHWGCAP